jgi:hypothetical protein
VVVFGRGLLFLLAAGAVVAALCISRGRHGSFTGAEPHYVCPMHPKVLSPGPSECPICGMALERISTETVTSAAWNGTSAQYFDVVRKRSFGQGVRAPAWVDPDGTVSALLYNDELALATPRARGNFEGAAVVALDGEPVAWDRSLSRVRFQADGAAAPALTPGAHGFLALAGKRRELLTIPASALLEGNDGPYVLVPTHGGKMLRKQSIEIGRVYGGMAFVVGGLNAYDHVLIRNTFFLDADRRLHDEHGEPAAMEAP